MSFQGGTKLNGPLKYAAHSQFPTGVNSVGGTAVQLAKTAYLNGAPLEHVDNLPVLAFGTPDDQPRCFGYSWSGGVWPFGYTTGTTVLGVQPTLTASSTFNNLLGGATNIVTSAGAPAINQYISGGWFRVVAGKRMWYNIRFSLQTVASEAVLVGFVNTGYAPADLTTLPTDGIFILKTIAGTDFSGIVRASSTSTTVATLLAASGGVALTDTTVVDLGILVDSGSDSGLLANQGAVSFYVNGAFAGQVAGTDPNMPAAATALCYFIGTNTTGGAKTMTVRQGCGLSEL